MSPQEIKFKQMVERGKEIVKNAEKKQKPFTAMFGKMMIYILPNN